MAGKRISLLNVPIDILRSEEIDKTVLEFLESGGVHQVVFLTIWDLLKARRRTEFREMILNASLVLPTSKSIITGAKFLKKDIPVRRQPFDVVIDFLNAVDAHYKSLYIFGGRQKTLLITEKNVKNTFPSLKIVGKYHGHYNKNIEKDIITSMVKSEPSLVLVSNGIPSGRKWVYRNKEKFKTGIFLYEPNILDVFAKVKNKPSEAVFNAGFEYIIKIFKNPFRIFKIFPFMWYKILLLVYRIFKVEEKKALAENPTTVQSSESQAVKLPSQSSNSTANDTKENG